MQEISGGGLDQARPRRPFRRWYSGKGRPVIGDMHFASCDEPLQLVNRSQDPDKDSLDSRWQIAGQELTGETPTVTLAKPGGYEIALTVDDGRGGSDRDVATVHLSTRDGAGTRWTMPELINERSSSDVSISGQSITLSGAGKGRRFTSLLACDEALSGSTLTATIQAVDGADPKQPAGAGLCLGERSAWKTYWEGSPKEIVVVRSDGSLWTQRYELQAAGSIRLPATMRLRLEDDQALWEIKAGAAWQQVHGVETRGTQHLGLAMQSGHNKNPGTTSVEDVTLSGK